MRCSLLEIACVALGGDPTSSPQGMADGLNALQGVGFGVLANPLHSHRARTRQDSQHGIVMVDALLQ